jgi:hypothetical protein
MSTDVHMFLLISMFYSIVGIAPMHNLNRIIMLQFPECPLLDARGSFCPILYKEFTTR